MGRDRTSAQLLRTPCESQSVGGPQMEFTHHRRTFSTIRSTFQLSCTYTSQLQDETFEHGPPVCPLVSATWPSASRSPPATMAPVKVCAIQAASVAYDLEASLTKLALLVEEAAASGARLAVLPEAFLSCYPRKLGFAVGARTEDDRQWFKRYVQSSVMIPGDAEKSDWLAQHDSVSPGSEFWAFGRICSIAKENKIVSLSYVGSGLG